MKLVWSNGFKRAFKKVIRKNPQLKDKIIKVLTLLANDPFTPSLKSHKLTGDLAGFWACSVSYDCRIIFKFSEDNQHLEMIIFLINVGTHDDLYN